MPRSIEIPGLDSSLGQNPVLGLGEALTTRTGLLLYGNQRALLGPFAQYWETEQFRPAAGDFLCLQ